MLAYILPFGTLFLILCLVLWESWRRRVLRYESQGLTGLPHLPWIGNALVLERDGVAIVRQFQVLMPLFNWRTLVWLGPQPLILTAKLEDAEALLKSTDNLKKSGEYFYLQPWLRTGLLTSHGKKWKTRRRLLTPAFHFGILKESVNGIKREADVLVSKLKPLATSGKSFDISRYITLCTLDVICEMAMGVHVNAQDKPASKYVEAVIGICALIQMRQRTPWFWPDLLYSLTPSGRLHKEYLKRLHEFSLQVIKHRIALRSETPLQHEEDDVEQPRRKQAFLDLLLNCYEEGEIDVTGIHEEVDTFMFEGHETTSFAISFCLYCLGRNPDIQGKLHKEIDEHYDDDPEVLEKQLPKMKLLDAVIKEGLRIYPAVPLIARAIEEDQMLGNLKVYKGTTVGLAVWGLHRNPNVWEDPETFNPERFLSEKPSKPNPFAYIPFSAGSRNCIGQRFAALEERIILATLLRHYEFESVNQPEELDITGELILRSFNGINLRLRERHPVTSK